MKEKIRVGFVGCGQFCKAFVPLFQAHPAVEFVAVTDKFPERCKQYDEMFHVDKIFDSFEQMIWMFRLDWDVTMIFPYFRMGYCLLLEYQHLKNQLPLVCSELKEVTERC